MPKVKPTSARNCSFFLYAALLLGVPSPAPAQRGQAQPPANKTSQAPPRDPNRTDFFICSYGTNYQLGPKAVLRRTDVFKAETTVDEVRRAWSQQPPIEQAPGDRHVYRPVCSEVSSTQDPQQLYDAMEAPYKERGGKIIHVSWKYGDPAPGTPTK
jgi:hypothetical protein